MIFMSSFSTVLKNQASGTVPMNIQLAKIINTFYDGHAKITGFFMILKAVGEEWTEFLHWSRQNLLSIQPLSSNTQGRSKMTERN